jgi:hypothetical protein
LEQEKHEAKNKKLAGKKDQEEMGSLFRPVQNVSKGADPKSVLCVFFKQGQCSKGDKCKFSHDLTLERKSEKKSIYTDSREDALENGSQHINSKSSFINTTNIGSNSLLFL